MHLRHLLATAVLVAACLPLLAGPASATSGPAGRDTGVHVPRLSCTGDTVRVTAVVRGQRDLGPATVRLLAGAGGVWSDTGRLVTVGSTKPGRNTWTLDAAGLGVAVTTLRAEIRATGASVLTPAVPVARCAPGTEVPEVPAAALLPLTLAATGTAVLAVRTRRAARVPA